MSKTNSYTQPNNVIPPNINQVQQQARLQQLKLQFQQQALMQQQVQQQAQLRGINVSQNQNKQQINTNGAQQFPTQQAPRPITQQNAKDNKAPGSAQNVNRTQEPSQQNQEQPQAPNQANNSFGAQMTTGSQNQGPGQSNTNPKNQPSVSKRNIQSLDAYQMTLLQMENQNNLQRQRFLQQQQQQQQQLQHAIGFNPQTQTVPIGDDNNQLDALFSLDKTLNFSTGAPTNLQQQQQLTQTVGDFRPDTQPRQQKMTQDQFPAQLSAGDNVIDDSFFSSNILLDEFKPSDIDVDQVFNDQDISNNNANNGGGMIDIDSKLDDIGETLRKDWLSSMGSGQDSTEVHKLL